MKQTVILEQVKMVTIVSPDEVSIQHGFTWNIPGKDWYYGEFTTQEDADAIFEEVKRIYRDEYESIGSWMEPPKMTIDWVTVKTKVIPESDNGNQRYL